MATDCCGNSNSCSFTVTVQCGTNTPPATNLCIGSLYALSQDATGFSTLNSISTGGSATPLFGVGPGFDALAYAAPDLGYGAGLFYAIQNDYNNFSTLYSISPSGVSAGLISYNIPGIGCGGQSFSALTFAAPDLGFGPNLLYGVMTAANGASCLLYTSVNAGGTLPLGFGSGSGFLDLAFAAPDLGYGSDLFYAISVPDPSSGVSELYTIFMPGGAVVPRASLGSGYTWAGLAFVPDDLGFGPNLFYALAADHTGGSFLLTVTAAGVATERGTLAPFGFGSGKLAYRPSPFSFQCPADIVRVTSGGSAVVDYPMPVPLNNCCGNATVTCVPPSGSAFGPGTTTVNCLAVDCAGHTNICSFTVTVITQPVAPALSGNLTFNGSFEASNHPGNGALYSSDPSFTLPGWTWSSGSNQISVEYGQPAGFPRYADGNQAVGFHGNGRPVSISQTFETAPGQNYILRFAQSDENNAGPSCSQLTVSVAGLIRVFSLTNDSGNHLWEDHGYRLQAMQFTAQSNWTTLTFTDTSAPGCPSPFLDCVCVNPGSALLASLSTPIPGGMGSLSNFPDAPVLSGDEAAFLATDEEGDGGIYWCPTVPLAFPLLLPTAPPPGPVVIIADTTTAIPGGNGNFTTFNPGDDLSLNPQPLPPKVSSNNVVFWGEGSGGQQGIYGAFGLTPGPNPGPVVKIVDLLTAIPGGEGSFTTIEPGADVSLNPQPLPPKVGANNIVFWGKGSGGQQGIYGAFGFTPGPNPGPVMKLSRPQYGPTGRRRQFHDV